MTEGTAPVGSVPEEKVSRASLGDKGAPQPAGRGTRRRHPAARARIAAAGMGLTAMLALVSKMEVTDNRAQAAGSAGSWAAASSRTLTAGHSRAVRASAQAAARASRPIVLTAHAVVHTVGAPSSGGSGGSGYAASAPASASAPVSAPAAAPAAAPVASTGGSQ